MVEQGVSLDTQPVAARGRHFRDAGDVSIQLQAGPSAAALARNALVPMERRLDDDVMADVRLLVSELVTNSVRHADMPRPGVVNVDVSLDAQTIHVEVRDNGPGFEPRRRSPGQSKAGGWGLYLVERLADRWGVMRNSVTRVWFEIDLGRSSHAAL
ncbi:MAG: serine/threonine-protein kinase RsbW [Thermoleophilaceae bacterium]|jgi:anti-sigma regulatory factor (Ser/Thr protein kinase)|nr:serine/threonine-protein kinase RsbW [Thermoleophilaceae bacterium]MEA2437115.1 serine/threonine-protein kinase RsbW [Thermoleophilaceae bacterium]